MMPLVLKSQATSVQRRVVWIQYDENSPAISAAMPNAKGTV
jgi:hypothetical protein